MRRLLRVRPARYWLLHVLVLYAWGGGPQSLGAQVGANHPQGASGIRTISGSAARGTMLDQPAFYGRFAVRGMAGIDQSQLVESATSILPDDFIQEAREGSAWKKGLLIGAAAGVALGILVHAAVDSAPCDSCIGTGNSAAEGTRLEFALIFGLAGGGLGAFLGSRR